MGRARLCPLLASTSLAALLIGVGTPAAFAACQLAPTSNVDSVTNPSAGLPTPLNCIDINGITVTHDVTNAANGVIIAPGSGFPNPTANGITISNSTIGGGVVNAGRITSGTSGHGILIFNNATVFGGISNSGTISADHTGIKVSDVTTFAGGITNAGTISAGAAGIDVFYAGSGTLRYTW